MDEESTGFIHEVERNRRIYRDGLITKSEYLLKLILLCVSELALETQELYEERRVLERIRKEIGD